MRNIGADLTFLVQAHPTFSMIMIGAIFLFIVIKRIVKTCTENTTKKLLKNIETQINKIEKSQQENKNHLKDILRLLNKEKNEK